MEYHELNSILTADGIYADYSYAKRAVNAAAHRREEAHIHDYCEVYFNLQGNVSFSVENTIYPVESGDLIITMPNEVHYCIYNGDCTHEHYCLWVRTSEPFQALLAPFYERERGQGNRIRLNDREKEELKRWVDTLLRERDENRRVTVKSGAAVMNILDLLNDVKHRTAAPLHLPKVLKEILAHIESELGRTCTVQSLCDTFFISRSSLGRLFKQYLGTTPSKYVENKRLALSKRLLEEGLSVQATCERCGFPDYSHFIALFRTRFGITPFQYSRKP